ncbi:MAG: repair exonuclease [Rhizobacter sp.]|nr:repair exonuclease [Rhizobacter sp.]
MTLLLQISDTHFGTERPTVMDALKRLSDMRKPDVVMLSGDITQRATVEQFAGAKAYLQRLGIARQLIVPGNHDIPLYNLPARLFSPYGHMRTAFDGPLEPVFESDDLLLIGVKSTRRYRRENGEVSDSQIDRVAERLSRARPGQWRVVVTHQPVCVTKDKDEKNLLRNRERAVARWCAAGADVLMGGHIHLPFVAPLGEFFGGLSRPMWAVQAGTALSTRIRYGADNSVNLLRCGPSAEPQRFARECVVERWDYVKKEDEFMLIQEDRLSAPVLPHPSERPTGLARGRSAARSDVLTGGRVPDDLVPGKRHGD